jgi:integrase
LKRAALFSALTGLRFSDIKNLVWGELEYIEGNGYFIKFKQQKTKGVEMMPILNRLTAYWVNAKNPPTKYLRGLLIQHTKTNTLQNGLEQLE